MKKVFTIKANNTVKVFAVTALFNFIAITSNFAQTYYSNFTTNAASHQVSTPTQIVIGIPPFTVNVDIGTFTNASMVADDPITNYSTYSNTIGLSLLNSSAVNVRADLNLGTNTSLPAGSTAGFVIDNTASLINLSIANSITVSTYLNGTLQESSSTTNPLSVSVFTGDTIQDFHFTTTKSFNQVSINVGSGVIGASLFQDIRFYYAYGIAKAVLPVAFTTFTATPQVNTAKLEWATASETNSKGFAIERSTDGTNFSEINFVASQATGGNSSSSINYFIVDATPAPGINYYRIKQVDIDGHFTYSNIQAVVMASTAIAKIYPNPVTNFVNIETGTPGIFVADLFTVDGRKVKSTQLATASGLVTLNIDRANIISGIYLLKMTGKSGSSITYNTIIIK